jgi:hypothetical protein
MNTRLIILFLFILPSCKTIYTVKVSEPDAIIYVDGKEMGVSPREIEVRKNDYKNITAKKTGFFEGKISLYYYGLSRRTEEIKLIKDDSYEASIQSNYANNDFEQEIDSKFSEGEAWKIASQIITNYIDNLEMADAATGYMRTTWVVQSFNQSTIRTRIIVRQSSSKPLKLKIKIQSEIANHPNVSVKDDDKFKNWDRILKKYDVLITEFQTRLGAK